MFNTIRSKVLLLALLPAALLTVSLEMPSLKETKTIAEAAIGDVKNEFINQRKEELKNYLNLARSAINDELKDPPVSSAQTDAYSTLKNLRFDGFDSEGYVFAYDLKSTLQISTVIEKLQGGVERAVTQIEASVRRRRN